VIRTPFYGGFGLMAEDGIPKPALNAFAMLHQLGDQRIKLDSDSALATRRRDGSLAIALWNYAPPYGTGAGYTSPPAELGPAKTFTIKLVQVWRLDADHGNVVKIYDAMGRPPFPTREQIEALREAGQPAPPETLKLRAGSVSISVPPQGMVLIMARATR
jgi:xylan 1,4-beta-xylosidase